MKGLILSTKTVNQPLGVRSTGESQFSNWWKIL